MRHFGSHIALVLLLALAAATGFVVPQPARSEAATAPPLVITGAQVCAGQNSERFFEVQGQDYTLQLGNTAVEIIGRKSWGALPPLSAGRSWETYPRSQSLCQLMKRITVHHTHSRYTIELLQRRHQNMDEDPKADVAYHFFIARDGRIYEGRPLGFIGSHSESDNPHNIGIALNGNFRTAAPTLRQQQALRSLLAALQCPCGSLDGIWTHQQRKALNFPGQLDKQTDCPGTQLVQLVTQLAQEQDLLPELTDQTAVRF